MDGTNFWFIFIILPRVLLRKSVFLFGSSTYSFVWTLCRFDMSSDSRLGPECINMIEVPWQSEKHGSIYLDHLLWITSKNKLQNYFFAWNFKYSYFTFNHRITLCSSPPYMSQIFAPCVFVPWVILDGHWTYRVSSGDCINR